MLYESYEQKIKKLAKVKFTIIHFRFLIMTIAIVIMGLVIAYWSTAGGFRGELELKSDYVYGETIEVEGEAIFSRVSYEYLVDGEWTPNKPTTVGTYTVRGVSKNAFGGARYSKESTFKISKKHVDVNFTNNSVEYGEKPILDFEGLVDGDKYFDAEFKIENKKSLITNVEVIEDSIKIKNGEDKFVQDNYEFNLPEMKELTFKKRNITIELINQTKTYDGKPLELSLNEECYKLNNTLAFDQKLTNLVFNASITNAGSTSVGIAINNSNIVIDDDLELFDLYNFNVIGATLTVNKRDFTLYTQGIDDEIVYDGNYHDNIKYSFKVDSLAEGELFGEEKLKISDFKKFIYAGAYKNEIIANIILDGNDITNNYNVVYEYGDIIITPRPITIKPIDVTETYNGKIYKYVELKNIDNNFTYNEGSLELVNNDILKITDASASYRDAGEYSNIINEFIIKNSNIDVKNSYNVTLLDGIFNINKRDLSVKLYDVEVIYNAKEQSYNRTDVQFINNTSLASTDRFEIISTNTNCINVNINNEAKVTDYIIYQNDEDVTKNYNVNLDNNAKFEIKQYNLSIKPKFTELTYDGNNHLYDNSFGEFDYIDGVLQDNNHNIKLNVELQKDDKTVTANSFGDYIIVINSIEFNDSSIEANYNVDFSTTEIFRINKKVINIVLSDKSFEYKGADFTFNDLDCYSLNEEINENHRIELNYDLPKINDASIYNVLFAIDKTIIKNGDEDVTNNYIINFNKDNINVNITKKPLNISLKDTVSMYDGNNHYYDNNMDDISLENSSLIEGHKLSFITLRTDNSSATCLDAGIYNYIISSSKIEIDDLDVTKNYEISYIYSNDNYSIFEITKRTLEVELLSDTVIYNGYMQEFKSNEESVLFNVVSEIKQVLGDIITLSVSYDDQLAQIYAGKYSVKLMSFDVRNSERNVTENYDIKAINNGSFEIKKREITISSIEDVEIIYDGYYHSYNNLAKGKSLFNVEGIAEVDKVIELNEDYKYKNNFLAPGTYTFELKKYNSFDIVSKDTSENKSENYIINYKENSLIIDKLDITIKPIDEANVYNGKLQQHSSENVVITNNLPYNHTVSTTVKSLGKTFVEDNEEIVSILSTVIYRYDQTLDTKTDVTSYFNITTETATFKIIPRKVSIKPIDVFDESIVYNNTNQKYENYSFENNINWCYNAYTEYEIVDGDIFNLEFKDQEYIHAQSYDIEISDIKALRNGKDITQSYEFVKNYDNQYEKATYIIYPRPIIIKAIEINDVYYNGNNQNYNSYTFEGNNWTYSKNNIYELCEGHTIKVSALENGEYINAITYKISLDIEKLIVIGENVKENDYKFTTEESDYVINRRPISVKPIYEESTYDGYEHFYTKVNNNSYEYVGTPDELHKIVEGQYLYIVTSYTNNGVIDAGTYKNYIVSYYVSNDGNISDVTKADESKFINNGFTMADNYLFNDNTAVNDFVINKIEITINPIDKETTYCGKYITYSSLCDSDRVNYEIIGVLAETDSISCTSNEAWFDAKKYEFRFTNIEITNSRGDATKNYAITSNSAELTINKCSVTITPEDGAIVYDGMEHTYRDSDSYKNLIYEVTYAIEDMANHNFTYDATSDSIIYVIDGPIEVTLSNIKAYVTKDNNTYDTTANFDFTLNTCEFKIIPREVIIVPNNCETVYNGHEQIFEEILKENNKSLYLYSPDTSYKLASGDHFVLEFNNNKQTNSGKYEISFASIRVYKDDKDVTTSYDTNKSNSCYSSFKIIPREIKIKLVDIEVQYDGKDFDIDNYWKNNNQSTQWTYCVDTKYELVSGHELMLEANDGTYKNAREYETSINEESITITYNNDNVKDNYVITCEKGKLVIKPRELKVKLIDQEVTYNGVAQYYTKIDDATNMNWSYVDGSDELVSGDYVYLYTSINKDPQTYVNLVDGKVSYYENKLLDYYVSKNKINDPYKINEEMLAENKKTEIFNNYIIINNDVTAKFTINQKEITISPYVTISPYDNIKVEYTGKIANPNNDKDGFKNNNGKKYILKSGSICDGEKLDVTLKNLSENAINVGKYDVGIDTLSILKENNNITYNYAITYETTKYEIIPIKIIMSPTEASVVYDGNSHNYADTIKNNDYTYLDGSGKFISSDKVEISVKFKNGEDLVDSVINAKEYESIIDSIKINGVIYEGNGNYEITCETSIFTIEKREIQIKLDDVNITYDREIHYSGNELTDSNKVTYTFKKDSLAQGETLTVYANANNGEGAKNAGEYTLTSYKQVISGGQESLDNYDITIDNSNLIINKKEIHYNYTGESVVYDGKKHEYDESAFERTTDLDYELDFSIKPTFVSEKTGKESDLINAGAYKVKECEYDVNDKDDSKSNYTFIADNKEDYRFDILKRELKVSIEDQTKIYNGKEQIYNGSVICDKNLLTDHEISATVKLDGEDSKTNAGIYESKITEVVIKNGKEDVTDNYNVDLSDTKKFEIAKKEIDIKPSNLNCEYTGYEISALDVAKKNENIWDYNDQNKKLVHGHKLEVTGMSAKETKVGKYENKITDLVIKNGKEEDVTNNYDYSSIKNNSAVFEITQMTIEITIKELATTYNGKPQSFDDLDKEKYEVTYGSLNPNHKITSVTYDYYLNDLKLADKPVNANKYVTKISKIIIKDENDNDVTDQYLITYKDGLFTINKRELNISSGVNKVTYDGNEHTYEHKYEHKEDSLCEGHTLGYNVTKDINSNDNLTGTNAGKYNGYVNYFITSADGEDVSSNYDIKTNNDDESGNHKVTLEINKRELNISSEVNKVTYDGNEHIYEHNYEHKEGLLCDGHTLGYNVTKDINSKDNLKGTNAGKYNGYVNYFITSANGEDVSSNYDIKTNDDDESGNHKVTLEIEKREITIKPKEKKEDYNGKKQEYTDDDGYIVEGLEGLKGFKVENIRNNTNNNDSTDGNFKDASEDPYYCYVTSATVKRYDEDVTENFIINSGSGDTSESGNEYSKDHNAPFYISKKKITISPKDIEIEYSGTKYELSSNDITVSGLNAGHKIKNIKAYSDNCIHVKESITNNQITRCEIYDENDKNVSSNYEITYVGEANFTITPRSVNLSFTNENLIYNGEAQSYTDINTDDKNGILSQDKIYFMVSTTSYLTHVGRIKNDISIEITDDNIRSDYDLKIEESYIKVNPRTVKVIIKDEKMYDGTPLVAADVTPVLENAIYKDHIENYLVVESNSSITNIGELKVEASLSLSNYEYQADYNLMLSEDSLLKITSRSLLLKSQSKEEYFNGAPITISRDGDTNLEVVKDEDHFLLPKDHKLYGYSNGVLYVQGETENTIDESSIKILNENGDDVTKSFDLSYSYGKLIGYQYTVEFYTLNKTLEYSFDKKLYEVPKNAIKLKDIKLDTRDKNEIGLKNKPKITDYEVTYNFSNGEPTGIGKYEFTVNEIKLYSNGTLIGSNIKGNNIFTNSCLSILAISNLDLDVSQTKKPSTLSIVPIHLEVSAEDIDMDLEEYYDWYNGDDITEFDFEIENYNNEEISDNQYRIFIGEKVFILELYLKSETKITGACEDVQIIIDSCAIYDENGKDVKEFFNIDVSGTITIS